MKKLFGLLVLMAMVLTIQAQEQMQMRRTEFNRQGFMQANPSRIAPELTAEQSEQIAKLRLDHQKMMLEYSNFLAEKKAQLVILEKSEKPDLKKINSKIDEISDLQNKKMKATSEHKVKIRSILTDEQRVKMDLLENRRGSKRGISGVSGNEFRKAGENGQRMNFILRKERVAPVGMIHQETEVK